MLMLSSCRDSHQPAASQYTRNQGRTNISAPSQIQIHKYILLCTILQPQLQISTIWYCLYLRWRLRVGLTLFTTLFIASWSCTVHFLLLRGSGKREGGRGGGLLKGADPVQGGRSLYVWYLRTTGALATWTPGKNRSPGDKRRVAATLP